MTWHVCIPRPALIQLMATILNKARKPWRWGRVLAQMICAIMAAGMWICPLLRQQQQMTSLTPALPKSNQFAFATATAHFTKKMKCKIEMRDHLLRQALQLWQCSYWLDKIHMLISNRSGLMSYPWKAFVVNVYRQQTLGKETFLLGSTSLFIEQIYTRDLC